MSASERTSLSAEQYDLLRRASAVCRNIRAMCIAEAETLCARIEATGAAARFDASADALRNPQYHRFDIVLDGGDPSAAVEVALAMGYRPAIATGGAEWEVFRRTRDHMTLTKTDAVTMRLVLRWSARRPRPPLLRRVWPVPEDARFIALPRKLWPLTFLIRPIAVLRRRLGRSHDDAAMGPFLGTPQELIAELLDFATLNRDDVLLDLGCGDGRVLVTAAQRYGCRAIGYERDEALCALARGRAGRSDVADLVDIRHADAASASVEQATVVFLFLPPHVVTRTVGSLLQRLSPGGRIVAHEQLRIETHLPPARSVPLITRSAATVAHLWVAPR